MPDFRVEREQVELGLAIGGGFALIAALLLAGVGPVPAAAGLVVFLAGWCAYAVGFGGAALARARW